MRFDFGSLARRLVTAAIVWTGAATVGAAAEGPVDVTIDFAKVMRLDTPARTVIVGNPGIADASIDNEKTLVLTGKTAGTTNLIVLDVNGHEISELHDPRLLGRPPAHHRVLRSKPGDVLLRAGLRAGDLGRRREGQVRQRHGADPDSAGTVEVVVYASFTLVKTMRATKRSPLKFSGKGSAMRHRHMTPQRSTP